MENHPFPSCSFLKRTECFFHFVAAEDGFRQSYNCILFESKQDGLSFRGGGKDQIQPEGAVCSESGGLCDDWFVEIECFEFIILKDAEREDDTGRATEVGGMFDFLYNEGNLCRDEGDFVLVFSPALGDGISGDTDADNDQFGLIGEVPESDGLDIAHGQFDRLGGTNGWNPLS